MTTWSVALLSAIVGMLTSVVPSRQVYAQSKESDRLTVSAQSDTVVPEFFDSTMVRGRRDDWTGYTIPAMCVQAATVVHNAVRRGADWNTENDTGTYSPQSVTVSDSVARVARSCGARFHAATAPIRDLLDVAHLALLQGDDAEAGAAATRYVESFPAGEARYRALLMVDTMYLFARPSRLAAADSIAALLDTYGTAAAKQREEIRTLLLGDATRRYDVPSMERHAVAGLKIQDELKVPSNGNFILTLFLGELYGAPGNAPEHTMQVLKSAGLRLVNMDSIPLMLHLFGSIFGHPAPPLKADFWMGVDSATQVWPVPGKPSILVLGSQREFPGRAAMWRRIALKYGSAVNITFLCKTEGAFHNGPPLTPAEEAARLGRYYRDDLQMPVTVAVRGAQYKVLPDGRRLRLPSEPDRVDRGTRPITDASGKVIFMGFDDTATGSGEAVITKWIDRALGRDQAATSTPKSAQ